MASALKYWEMDNNVELVDPKRDGLYAYDPDTYRNSIKDNPWRADARYFKRVRISAVALIKMVMHARSGGSLEVMGLMQGFVDSDCFVVTDAFRLPVEGTETRVNAHTEADEYMVEYLRLSREQGARQENVVGWYHSHPGYGCWLSGIDVGTQQQQQQFNEPFLAVVIDPDRTINSGKVEIGAFRTLPLKSDAAAAGTAGTASAQTAATAGQSSSSSVSSSAAAAAAVAAAAGTTSAAAAAAAAILAAATATAAAEESGPSKSAADYEPNESRVAGSSNTAEVPLYKASEFGAHADKYYSLEVSHFKSTLDARLLELLWDKYWVQTLSQSPLFSSRDFSNSQLRDLAGRVGGVDSLLSRPQGPARPGNPFVKRPVDNLVEKLAAESSAVSIREQAGLMALDVKANVFGGGFAEQTQAQQRPS